MGGIKRERDHADMGRIMLAEELRRRAPHLDLEVLSSMTERELSILTRSLERDGLISELNLSPIDESEIAIATRSFDKKDLPHRRNSPSTKKDQ